MTYPPHQQPPGGGNWPEDNWPPMQEPVSYPDPNAGYADPYQSSGVPYQSSGVPYQQPVTGPPMYQQPVYSTPMYTTPMVMAPARKTNGMATASLVVSLVSLVVCGGAVGIIGAILGHVAKKQIRETGEDGDGMALAGIIVGWVTFGLSLIWMGFVLLAILAAASAGTSSSTY